MNVAPKPPILISRFILNLRRSATHSGYTRDESELETSQTITGVVFREVTHALEELGQELYDGPPNVPANDQTLDRRFSGLSNFLMYDKEHRISWASQSDQSSTDGHETVAEEHSFINMT